MLNYNNFHNLWRIDVDDPLGSFSMKSESSKVRFLIEEN